MKASEWPRYHYTGTVIKTPRGFPVFDGDTFYCWLDLGDYSYRKRRIRILGFDAPEPKGETKEAGLIAADALSDLIPVGCTVYLKTNLDKDNLNRLLAWTHVEGSDGNLYDVSEAMISGGFGEAA